MATANEVTHFLPITQVLCDRMTLT